MLAGLLIGSKCYSNKQAICICKQRFPGFLWLLAGSVGYLLDKSRVYFGNNEGIWLDKLSKECFLKKLAIFVEFYK